MTKRSIGWAAYIIVFVFLGAIPYAVMLPTPEGGIRITGAHFTPDAGVTVPVSLPHRWGEREKDAKTGVYEVEFELATRPDAPLYLFIPALKRHVEVQLNGATVFDSKTRQSWAGPLVQATALSALTVANLRAGRNTMRLHLKRESVIHSYLSELYIAPKETVVPHFKRRVFINERFRAMSYSAQVLLAISLFVAYLYRRKETVFGWLTALIGLSGIVELSLFSDAIPWIMQLYPHVYLLWSVIGCIFVIFALAMIDRPAPRALIAALFLIPATILALIATGAASSQALGIYFSVPLLFLGSLAAIGIVVWGGVREKRLECFLILGPMTLFLWYLLHDTALAYGYIDGNGFFTRDTRPLLLAIITIVLMRRLAISLNELDKTEEYLRERLQAKEVELDAYYKKEREAVERTVIDAERRRLINDLHDGMGGHLVSIIAMAEDSNGRVEDIRNAGRAALEDLRIVIHSLNIGSSGLPFVLAAFRDRLQPVMRRLKIEFDWSMATLPEIKGVGPGNALLVLRILQEAVTNAQKHGNPRKISIHGLSESNDMFRLIVENTGGTPFAAKDNGTGNGLQNMRTRANSLGGTLDVETLPDGARVVLHLPSNLPHF